MCFCPSSTRLQRTSKRCGLGEAVSKLAMFGEEGLRSLSTTGACTVLVCAGACHLARQYWLGADTTRREEWALHKSKRKFVERIWNLVTQARSSSRYRVHWPIIWFHPCGRPYPPLLQDSDTENDLVKDLGPADHQGVYTSTSALVPDQTIYLRRAPTSGALGGFEWSVERLVWLPTASILDDVLSLDHEVRCAQLVDE